MDLSDQTTGISPADMSKKSQELQEPDNGRRSALSANMSSKPTAECGGDSVQLIVEGYSPITIRKETLRGTSDYFANLLKYSKEPIRMTPPPNVDPRRYVYLLRSVSYNLPPAVDECNMWDYLVLARYFRMEPLEDTCRGLIRQALRTMTMDEFCRFWRKARAEQCGDMTKWFLAGIVRNLEQAQTLEFLNFGVEELMALLMDDEFLPLFEEPVYKAIIDWCEYIPEQRMTRDVLDVLLAEIVWDRYDINTIRQLASSAQPLLRFALEAIAANPTDRKKPKRAVQRHLIFGHEAWVQHEKENRRTRELLHYDSLHGTLGVWNAPAARSWCSRLSWRYITHDLQAGRPTVIFQREGRRVNSTTDALAIASLVDGKVRLIGNGLPGAVSGRMGGYNGTPNWCYQPGEYGFLEFDLHGWKWERKVAPSQWNDLQRVASCSLQLPEGERVATLLSITQPVRRGFVWDGIPKSVIGHHKPTDFLSTLVPFPALPGQRLGAAIIQCRTFLFVTGGFDMTDSSSRELAQRCYRLDLTTRDRWERIGDLSVPRVDHCMFVQLGRVFVYGGSTLDNSNVALTSFETYDPYADIWTAFSIPLTGGGPGEVGSGSISRNHQETYCLDLGSSLDKSEYRDIEDEM